MERYKYRALNMKGRPVRGVVSAKSEIDLYNQLQSAGLELLHCAPLLKRKGILGGIGKKRKVAIRDLIQLFIHLDQMQGAGISLLDALSDIRDASDHPYLRDIMTEIHRNVSEGTSLSEAMAMHPKVFGNLYVSLVASGEETGNLAVAYKHLVSYLKWVDEMQTRVRKATRYPMILLGVVCLTVVVMMGYVVPQVVGFIKNLDQEIPVYTKALMATSDFFVSYWWAVFLVPIVAFIGAKIMRKMSRSFAFTLDSIMINLPVAGGLIRKINIARFAQTFGAMYASGIDVLKSLESARNTVSNLALLEALEIVRERVQTGAPLSEAFNDTGEFPSMVVRMLKVGEESGNLLPVLQQVSDFYTKDVDETIQAMIAMIEPFLTAFLGGMILWIAVAVFGPIYSSFENIDF
ncbi:MAG: type II secretion system F family protein [Alphaproteobacteria bacterium]|nr:type II secretion system F family protein [Alphaproteobacteria bacterium]